MNARAAKQRCLRRRQKEKEDPSKEKEYGVGPGMMRI